MTAATPALAHGREQLSIPGPSVIPDRVLQAMHRPAPNIYKGDIIEMTSGLFADLNKLAGNSGDIAFYIGNGHASWEACLCNAFSRGDKALFLVNGRFGALWVESAKALGMDAQVIDFGHDQAVDAEQVEAALKADSKHEIKAVLTVHTDTASSASNNLAAVRAAIDNANHPALFMVDSIASFGVEEFNMDELRVDAMMSASQKGLMTPPGVALLFMSKKFWELQSKAGLVTPYWNAHRRVNPSYFHEQFHGTPPTHHMFAMREAVDMLLEEGMDNVWKRHEYHARAVWRAVETWGEGADFSCNIQPEHMRSRAVTTIRTAPGVATDVQRWCNDHHGVVLGVGLAPVAGGVQCDYLFRIGHMGHLSPPMLLGTLGSIESALIALGVPHGKGALEAAAEVLAV